ncbi:MFS transporter [Kiloniella sp. b19]|uniref:MFS transporter n=1 Tax=Kiloniella sp. GXU_MW_B19 TaxID=3141326 RepID=UPI0031D8131E
MQASGGVSRVFQTPGRMTALFCLLLVLGILDSGSFAALIVTLQQLWGLSNTEAGWISGIYFGGYAFAVPLLVTLTDRVDARHIFAGATVLGGFAAAGFAFWVDGFWSALLMRFLGGVSLAGTYMVGLRLLTDRLEDMQQDRKNREQEPFEWPQSRSVAFYTAHFAIGSGLSVMAAGFWSGAFGWRAAFLFAALCSFAALGILLCSVEAKSRETSGEVTRLSLRGLLNYGPVFRNHAAMAYVIGYAAHVWELFAMRAWLVAFLTFVLWHSGEQEALLPGLPVSPATFAALVFLLGLPSSVLANEAAARYGRVRVLTVMMISSGLVSLAVGLSAWMPLSLAVTLLVLHGVTATADSGSLTAGLVAHSDPDRKGATMAVQSLLGFMVGMMSPLLFGVTLDLAGGEREPVAWLLAYGLLAVGVLCGPLAFLVLRKALAQSRASRSPG